MGNQGKFEVGNRAERADSELAGLVRLLARAAAAEYVRGRVEGGLTPKADIGEQS